MNRDELLWKLLTPAAKLHIQRVNSLAELVVEVLYAQEKGISYFDKWQEIKCLGHTLEEEANL